MKVKNEYVQINMGNKSYIRKNMLLDVYLKRLFNSQIETTHDSCVINTCYLKLDTPMGSVSYDTELDGTEFDVKFYSEITLPEEFEQIALLDKNYIKLKYTFDNKEHVSFTR